VKATSAASVGLIAILAVITTGACSQPSSRSDVVWTTTDRPEVTAAMAEARKTLPIFWRHFDAKDPNTGELYVKAPFKTRHNGQEHMWVEPVRRSPTEIVGRLVDAPEDVDGLKPGDEVRFAPDRVSDWSYVRAGKTYGNFTTRLLLDSFGAEERQYAATHLSAKPVEAEDQ
jgi:uncharacterized protein YegJ (DUF2314 family)